jgi:hypothetical protein
MSWARPCRKFRVDRRRWGGGGLEFVLEGFRVGMKGWRSGRGKGLRRK